MTFSLKSSFDLANKRTLFVAADKAILFQSFGAASAGVDRAYVFNNDEAGRENFARYLEETNKSPIYILVDVVEEEYRHDVVPHVYGADRKSVLERKFARLFRGTKYCYGIVQGRESEGRRDDRVLLTAITKPDLLSPWVTLANELKVPVAGIFSLPILSQHLLKKIGAKGSNVLLISVQSASGLRQSFFRDQQLKISRLAQMPRFGSVPYASHVMGELEKLRRYLNSLALISKDGPLEVYILSHGELLSELEQHCQDSDEEKFFLVDVAEICERLGVSEEFSSPYSDAIFSQLLLDVSPPNHYAAREETSYFSLYRMRGALYAASVLILLASIGWSGINFLQAVSMKQRALDAAQKANFYQVRYEIARRSLPPTPVEPRDIKTAVDIVSTLKHHKSSPLKAMQIVSSAIETHSMAEIDNIEWFSNVDPNADPHTNSRIRQEDREQTIERDAKYSHYNIAVVKGRLSDFDGDYRQAIAIVDQLLTRISEQSDVHHTRVLQYPLDTTSEANLSGVATTEGKSDDARFVVRLVIGIEDGSEQT